MDGIIFRNKQSMFCVEYAEHCWKKIVRGPQAHDVQRKSGSGAVLA